MYTHIFLYVLFKEIELVKVKESEDREQGTATIPLKSIMDKYLI